MNPAPKTPRKPVGYVRFLAFAFAAAVLWMHNATAATPNADRPDVVEGTPAQVMAEHGCTPDVALIDSTGVVVNVNGAATYQAGTEAAGRAYERRANITLYAFCR